MSLLYSSKSDIPNFESKYPIIVNIPEDVEAHYNYEFILDKQKETNNIYNKDDVILLKMM